MDRRQFKEWLDRYVEAWKTYDENRIGALFSDDAVYRYHPQDEGVRGRAAIVTSWLNEPDDAGTYDAHYEPLAIDGEIHVANGWSRYFNADASTRDEYLNVYVCRFNDARECTEFTEYWIQNRDFRRRDRERLIREARSGGEA